MVLRILVTCFSITGHALWYWDYWLPVFITDQAVYVEIANANKSNHKTKFAGNR